MDAMFQANLRVAKQFNVLNTLERRAAKDIEI